ncbi:MAG: S-layer homology domain-containing protein [Actinomycetota bacterium]
MAVATIVAVLSGSFVTAAPTGAAVAGFRDVEAASTAASAIEWLVDQEITNGTGPDTFSPGGVVTRAQMATFLHRFAGGPDAVEPDFVDVGPDTYYTGAVGWLASTGITTGTSTHTYSPGAVVTRAQMATFLFRFAGEPSAPAPDFVDVPSGRFYTDAVGWLASTGITTGTTPDTFSPDDPVTRAQMALFLHRYADRPDPGDPGINRTPGDFAPVAGGDAAPPTTGAFVEAGGLVVIETSSLVVPAGWRRFPGDAAGDPVQVGATNGSFIQWGGPTSFNDAGNGLITIEVEINDPGRYRFVWHNAVGIGSDGTEHNDSFLRIDADSFFGERNGSVVCPDDQPSGNRCVGDEPQGSSTDGFFKVYRSGSTDGFSWRAFTSDHDAHDLYAEFDEAGVYTIRIAGRSEGHAIDRIVLFRSGNGSRDVEFSDATDLDLAESARR